MPITSKQAKQLKVRARTQLSPHMEKCCLLTSGNESYERAMKNVKELTGITVSHSTQQRLVQRYEFPAVELADTIEDMSLDGGKVRLRTAKGQKSEWKDYKLVTLQGKAVVAYFQDNQALIERVQQQPLAEIVSCLGDGDCQAFCVKSRS